MESSAGWSVGSPVDPALWRCQAGWTAGLTAAGSEDWPRGWFCGRIARRAAGRGGRRLLGQGGSGKAMVKRTANRTDNCGGAAIRSRPAKRDGKFMVCLLPTKVMGIKLPSMSSRTRDAIDTYDVSCLETAEGEKKFHFVCVDRAFAKPGGKPGMYGCDVGFAGSRCSGRE